MMKWWNYWELMVLYGEHDYYIEYEWIWEINDIEETVIVEFNDDEIVSKRYYVYGDIYGELAALDFDTWQSIDAKIDLDEFLERYGNYVSIESHSVYKHYNNELSTYVSYGNRNNDASFAFDFANGNFDNKSYYIKYTCSQ